MLLDDAELRALQDAAKREGLPVSEWVRRALRDARERQPKGDPEHKMRVVRTATRAHFPSCDLDDMLREIERGYRVDMPT